MVVKNRNKTPLRGQLDTTAEIEPKNGWGRLRHNIQIEHSSDSGLSLMFDIE